MSFKGGSENTAATPGKELQMDKLSVSQAEQNGNRLRKASFDDDSPPLLPKPRPIDDEETDTFDVGDDYSRYRDRDRYDEEEEADDGFEDDDYDGLMMLDPVDVIAVGIREGGLPGPPDGGWGYVILLASFMINLVMDGVTSSFSVLLPQIVTALRDVNPGIGRSDVAWAGSLLCGVSLCIGPVTSALTNKYGCRLVCMLGAVISSLGFAGAAYAPNLELLLVTYGLIGGIGFGLLYLPAIVCVSYYFEKKRARATGIAVSGSGFGAIMFAPLITSLSEVADWRVVCLGFAGILALLLFAGAAMKPLVLKLDAIDTHTTKHTPLLQRMADDKKHYMEKASFAGSTDFFMVQLPDGTMERRLKMSSNVDPGVHSGFYLDQLIVDGTGTPVPPSFVPAVDILPTISETKPGDGAALDSSGEDMAAKPPEPNGGVLRSPKAGEDVSPVGKSAAIAASLSSSKPKSKVSEPTDIPNSLPGRRRRSSDGEQSQGSPPGHHAASWGITRFLNMETGKERGVHAPSAPVGRGEVGRTHSFGRSTARPAKGSTAQISSSVLSTDTGIGDGSGIPSSVASPRDRRYSIRAVPTSNSLGRSRKDSFGSSQFRTSVSNVKGSRREIGDEDYKSLLSTSEFSQILRRSSTQKRSIFGDHSHAAHSMGGAGPASVEGDKLILRTMSRKDIFYSGSIHHLEEFQSQSLLGYRQSVLNLPLKRVSTAAGMDEEMGGGEEVRKPTVCPFMAGATGSFLSALAQMMDFSLCRNPAFLVIAISGVIGMLGFYVPIVYVIDFAAKKGIEEASAAYFISLIGVTSTVGRIAFGLLSDIRGVNSFLVYNICIIVMGVCTCILPLCFDYYLIATIFTIFGIAVSGFVALSSIILVKLLGLENLTNAFGLLLFFRGISTVLGTPLSGAIYDTTKSYDIPFYLAGSFLLISAVISFMGPTVTRLAGQIKVSREICKPPAGPLEDILEVVDEDEEAASAAAQTNASTEPIANANANGGTDAERDSGQKHHKNQEDEAVAAVPAPNTATTTPSAPTPKA